MLRTFVTAGALAVSLLTPAFAADAKLPPPPTYYVLDEPHVIPAPSLQALQRLLVEHDRATGEQVLIAVFNTLGGEDPVERTNRVFSSWGIGRRGKDNGVLLALYWQEHKARIEVGYGLESVLTDAKSKDVIEDSLLPELRSGDPGRGLTLAAYQILKTLESPLVENGEADRILRGGGFNGAWRARSSGQGSWFASFLFLGVILLTIVLNLLTARDAHFTSAGWYRPNPLSRRRWTSGLGGGGLGGGGIFGGGGGGGWGGGGGFMGGGGSSGGGGASGSW